MMPPRTQLRARCLALALAVTAVHAQWWQASRPAIAASTIPDLARVLPAQFAGWQRDDSAILRPISAADAAKADRAYVQTVEYVYVDAAQHRIMLSVSRGSQQGEQLQAHRPEFCYRAQGFAITASQDSSLPTRFGPLPLRRLDTQRPGRHEPVSYWMTVGDEATLPGWSRKLVQLRQSLSGQTASGLLVRVSSLDHAAAPAFALHNRFITDLLTALAPAARRQLAGRLAT